jgi:hypothetical protein
MFDVPIRTPARLDRTAAPAAARLAFPDLRRLPLSALLALLWALFPASAWAVQSDEDIVVQVDKDGATISVYVDCPVAAPALVAWSVLTDYDRMAQFISNLESSFVERREDNLLRVHQKGKASRGPLTFTFDNVREIELRPYQEIRSKMVSGELQSSEFTTRVAEIDGVLHIINVGRYVPKIWVPPVIGPALIAAETRKQFAEIRAEILRRRPL